MSCKKDELHIPIVPIDYTYIPLEVGLQKTFRIDSIIFNEYSGSIDSLSHYQRISIVDDFFAEDGQLMYRVKIEERFSDTLDWHEKQMDKLYIDDIRLVYTSDNISTVAMIFPVKEGVSWNANSFNTRSEQEYFYKNVNQQFSIHGKTYPSTLTIVQNNLENLIEKHYTEDKYAIDVGLFYRQDINLSTDFSGDTLSGYICHWTLLD